MLTPEDQRRLAEETNRRAGGLTLRQALCSTPVKTSKQARREAKQLFRLCRVNGVLDEARSARSCSR